MTRLKISDVMISYSRRDKAFVQRLEESLKATGREVWVDWQDIAPSADWWAAIRAGIEAAHTFVFIITPSSVRSEVCYNEIEHAVAHNKRFIPILLESVEDPEDQARMHRALHVHNWIFFTPDADFDTAFATLLNTLQTDMEHVQQHTRYLIRAREWDEMKRSSSRLLRGEDLRSAEMWMARSINLDPEATPLQVAYVEASRRFATRVRRVFTTGLVAIMVALSLLSVFALDRSRVADRQADIAGTQAAVAQDNLSTALAANDERQRQEQIAATNLAEANAASTAAARNQRDADRSATEAAIIQITAGTNAGNLIATAEAAGTEAARQSTQAANAGTQAAEQATEAAYQATQAANAGTQAASAGTQAASAGTQVGSAQTQAASAGTQVGSAQTQAAMSQQTAAANAATANAAAATAAANAATANAAGQTATANAATAAAANQTATSVFIQSESQRLMNEAQEALDEDDPALALHLALLAVQHPGATSGIRETFIRLVDPVRIQDEIRGFGNTVSRVTLSDDPDGPDTRLVVGSSGGSISVWDYTDGRGLESVRSISVVDEYGAPIEITSVAASVDAQRIIAGSSGGHFIIWDEGQPPYRAREYLSSIDLSDDGRWAVTARNSEIRVWDLANVATTRTVPQHTVCGTYGGTYTLITQIRFFRGGTRLVSVAEEDYEDYRYNTIKVWDFNPQTGQCTLLGSLPTDLNQVNSIDVWEYGSDLLPEPIVWLLTVSRNDTVREWDISGTDPAQWRWRRVYSGHSYGVYSVAASGGGGAVASGTDDGSLFLWRSTSGNQAFELSGHRNRIDSLVFVGNEDPRLLSMSNDLTMRQWDVGTTRIDDLLYRTRVDIPSSPRRIVYARINPYYFFFVATNSGIIRVVDSRSYAGLPNLNLEVSALAYAAFDDDEYLLTGSSDNVVRLWNDINSDWPNQLMTTLTGHAAAVQAVAFHPRGWYMASGSDDGTVRLWDFSGAPLRTMRTTPTDAVYDIAFTPDGTLLMAAYGSGKVRVWDVQTGALRLEWQAHASGSRIHGMALNPAGTRLVTSSRDSTLRVWTWDIGRATATELLVLRGHIGDVYSAAFSEDGNYIASAGDDSSVRLWDAQTGRLLHTFLGHSSPVYDVSFRPPGANGVASLASVSGDGTLRTWRYRPLDEVITWMCENRFIRQMTPQEQALYRVPTQSDCARSPNTFTPLPDVISAVPTVDPLSDVARTATALAMILLPTPSPEATGEITAEPTFAEPTLVVPTLTPEATAEPTFAEPTFAEPTLTPEATLTPLPPTLTATLTALPLLPAVPPLYAHMNDGAPGWTTYGVWRLDPGADVYGGGLGWRAAPNTANEVGFLTWQQPIDLRTASAPRLRFQSRYLSPEVNTLVQISVDGGTNWGALALVAPSEAWTEQVVDLSPYRGLIVWVQFVWLPVTPAPEQTAYWTVDEVWIDEAPLLLPTALPPTATPALLPQPTSALGSPPSATPPDSPERTPELTPEATAGF